MIRKSVNYHRDPYFKANAISNLAVIIYFECKMHNDLVDRNIDKKKMEERLFESTEGNKILEDTPEIEEKYRITRKPSENDVKMMKKMQMELEEYKIDEHNPKKDKIFKSRAKKMYHEEQWEEKKMSKKKKKEEKIENVEKLKEKLDILHKSK